MKRIVTAIDAIMVEGSAVGLARQLSQRRGIAQVNVNARTSTVAVDFDETRVQASDVGRYIAECGYHGLHSDSPEGLACDAADEAVGVSLTQASSNPHATSSLRRLR